MKNITVTKIEEVYTVLSPKGRLFEMIERPCYGLSLCIDGQITYSHKGKTYLSDPDHAVLLPKGQSYTLYGDKAGSFPVIDFQCTDFDCDTFLVFPLPNREAVLQEFEQIKVLSFHPEQRLKMMALFYELLSNLTAHHSVGNRRLNAAHLYLEAHLQEPDLNNTRLACAAGISEVYLRKLFLQQHGLSPKQFILERRLTNAKRLLTNSRASVTAVAEECGFSGVYHFCRIFKEKVGLTPTEYRKQNSIIGI